MKYQDCAESAMTMVDGNWSGGGSCTAPRGFGRRPVINPATRCERLSQPFQRTGQSCSKLLSAWPDVHRGSSTSVWPGVAHYREHFAASRSQGLADGPSPPMTPPIRAAASLVSIR